MQVVSVHAPPEHLLEALMAQERAPSDPKPETAATVQSKHVDSVRGVVKSDSMGSTPPTTTSAPGRTPTATAVTVNDELVKEYIEKAMAETSDHGRPMVVTYMDLGELCDV